MEIISQNGPQFRTKCLPLARAAAFARCLAANPAFAVAGIEESAKAKGDNRYFVAFAPTNPERIAAIALRQQDRRAERAASESAGYLWSQDESGRWAYCFNPISSETYEVSEHNCDCPDYRFRCSGNGIACKHMIAYRQALAFGDLAPDQQAQDEEEPAADNGPQRPGERRPEYVARTTPEERTAHARQDIAATFGRAA